MTNLNELEKLQSNAVDKAIEILSEYFDDVEVLVSRVNTEEGKHKGDTSYIARGSGNVHCRMGMARHFLETDKAMTLADELNGDDDE